MKIQCFGLRKNHCRLGLHKNHSRLGTSTSQVSDWQTDKKFFIGCLTVWIADSNLYSPKLYQWGFLHMYFKEFFWMISPAIYPFANFCTAQVLNHCCKKLINWPGGSLWHISIWPFKTYLLFHKANQFADLLL